MKLIKTKLREENLLWKLKWLKKQSLTQKLTATGSLLWVGQKYSDYSSH